MFHMINIIVHWNYKIIIVSVSLVLGFYSDSRRSTPILLDCLGCLRLLRLGLGLLLCDHSEGPILGRCCLNRLFIVKIISISSLIGLRCRCRIFGRALRSLSSCCTLRFLLCSSFSAYPCDAFQ